MNKDIYGKTIIVNKYAKNMKKLYAHIINSWFCLPGTSSVLNQTTSETHCINSKADATYNRIILLLSLPLLQLHDYSRLLPVDLGSLLINVETARKQTFEVVYK